MVQIISSTLALDHRKTASLVMDYLPASAGVVHLIVPDSFN